MASNYPMSGPPSGSGDRPLGGPGGRPPGRPGGRGRGRYAPRRKVCQFCVDKVDNIDYKDVTRLRRYVSERGKIEPRRKTGTCAKHQRKLSTAIKRAREVALLPYAPVHIQEMGGWFQPPPFLPQHQPPAPAPAPVPASAPDTAPAPSAEPAAAAAPPPESEAATAPTEAMATPTVASETAAAPVASGREVPPAAGS